MAQHPFLKSIRPVNLLSFGPNTEEIDLKPLNILIGPNGSGKSNLIEIIGLLGKLPERDPWTKVRETGGAREWVYKGKNSNHPEPSFCVKATGQKYSVDEEIASFDSDEIVEKPIQYSITLREQGGAFEVQKEHFHELDRWENDKVQNGWIERNEIAGQIHRSTLQYDSPNDSFSVPPHRSMLSMLGGSNISPNVVYLIRKFIDGIERFAFYRDWNFGSGFTARMPISAGQPADGLLENASNLAQLLARYQSDFRPTFDLINELMKRFYEPIKSVEVRIVSTHLQVAIQEEGGFSTPAYRLSDGTLRWLALLAILLNPTPAPITCIEEPELGLHPDAIHVLADLLVEASTRTQLIVTTHSDALLDAFTDTPEVVCVCEKVEGSTVIRRLDKEQLKIWLKDYSLGHLWMSGEIGGNRW
ncbi:MAG: AAA family ATPase [Terracidiphilus sp.]